MVECGPHTLNATSRAAFISYASQDAEAAGRICEALRAAGVEVWFDQSELRGGDAWDHSIRKQIKTAPCSYRSSPGARTIASRAISVSSGSSRSIAPT